MKRFTTLLIVLILVFSLFGCTPDNIVTPEPDDNQNAGQSSTEPVQKPATNGEGEQTKNENIKEKTEPNKEVMPSFDIDTLDYVKTKKADLKDKGITLYVSGDSFSAGDKNELEWMDSLFKELNFTTEYHICSPETLYSSQLIAQKSGFEIDVIYSKVNDVFSALSLMKSADGLVTKTNKDPFSAKIYELTGNKLFSGKANAKVMWYNTAIVKDNVWDSWSFKDFEKIAASAKTAGYGVLENTSFIEFMSTGKDQITGISKDGDYIMNAQDKSARDILADFSKTTKLDEHTAKDKKFNRDNVAFAYAYAPVIKRNATVNWAPLPRYGEDGTNVMALCGNGLALSKTVKEENVQTALSFIMLWCARYTESREDSLRFNYGISNASYSEFVKLCEQTGNIYTADREINSYLSGEGFPVMFWADDPYANQDPELSSLVYTVPSAYDRAKLLTERNK